MATQFITKLSQAIREGARLRPQAYGDYFTGNGRNEIQSCAIGAAYEAVTGKAQEDLSILPELHLARLFDLIEEEGDEENNPEYVRIIDLEGSEEEIFDVISHMNDYLYMTREQIADYLEKEGY